MFVLVASHFSLGILLRLNLFFSHVHPHCFMVVCFFFSMFHCLWVKPYVVQWLFSTAMITRGSLRPSTIKFSCFLYLKKHQFPIFFLEKIVFFPQNHHCSIFFPGKNHVFSTKPPFFHIFPWKKSWFLFHHHHVMSRPVDRGAGRWLFSQALSSALKDVTSAWIFIAWEAPTTTGGAPGGKVVPPLDS